MYKEIVGDLISLAKKGEFDVITHGCNCFCAMGAGIAVGMAREFGCHTFDLEVPRYRGDINKLGQIDFKSLTILENGKGIVDYHQYWVGKKITVVNSYTQYYANPLASPLDYDALTLCLRKINHIFKGQKIGLPQIGAGLAGGDWEKIKGIIQKELKDCDVTVVIYYKNV